MNGSKILGVIFIGIGLGAIARLDRGTLLTCNRGGLGNCQHVTLTGLESKTQQIPLARLQGAKVDVKQVPKSSDRLKRSDPMYRVVLLTPEGEIPFTRYYTGDRAAKEVLAQKINIFLENSSAESLNVEQRDRARIYLLGGLFIGIGATILGIRN
ncbi:hypothetical protein IQ249_14300 [Lusitaniella coriacea LEGE 07157]|uniref:Uncharacterized protein n=1 Tax=Lusitaniella coriacea LEGE 07157 TaxID=945747 RepID=A0A8J7DXD8_9CYAN|nr:hypothetical protein [Lusitaniella coriacea]MBE9117069.1 hypothetical protein [Lusitaniella coriacea LEGE 07157]